MHILIAYASVNKSMITYYGITFKDYKRCFVIPNSLVEVTALNFLKESPVDSGLDFHC